MSRPECSDLPRRAVAGTLWLTAGQWGASIVALSGNIVLARLLGPTPFGVFFLASSIADLVLLFGTFGFGQYLIQGSRITRSHYRAVMTLSASASATVVVIAFLVATALSGRFTAEQMSIFVALIALRACWSLTLTMSYLLDRAMAYDRVSAMRLASAIGSAMLAVVVAATGGGVWSLVARELGMLVAGGVVTWWSVRQLDVFSSVEPDDCPFRDVRQFGFRLSGLQILEQSFHRLDVLILTRLCGFGPTELGFYGQAKYVCSIPVIAADAGTRAVAYRLFTLLRDDARSLQRSLHNVQFWSVRAIMPAVVIFAAAPHTVFDLLMGNRWSDGAPLLIALAWYGLVMMLFNNLKAFRLAQERWSTLYSAHVAQIATLVCLAPVLSRFAGIFGAAVAFTAAFVVGLAVLARRTEADGSAGLRLDILKIPLIAATIALIVRASLFVAQVAMPAVPLIAVVLGTYGAVALTLERHTIAQALASLASMWRDPAVSRQTVVLP